MRYENVSRTVKLLCTLLLSLHVCAQTFTYSGYIRNADGTGAVNVPVKLYKRTTPVMTGFTSQNNYNGHSSYRSTGKAIWTTTSSVWISNSYIEQTRLKVDDDILYNKKCFAGLDLASTRDIAALVLCFPVQQGLDKPHIKSYFFCPEDNVRERSLSDGNDLGTRMKWSLK